jgi:hypothetical protein
LPPSTGIGGYAQSSLEKNRSNFFHVSKVIGSNILVAHYDGKHGLFYKEVRETRDEEREGRGERGIRQ